MQHKLKKNYSGTLGNQNCIEGAAT